MTNQKIALDLDALRSSEAVPWQQVFEITCGYCFNGKTLNAEPDEDKDYTHTLKIPGDKPWPVVCKASALRWLQRTLRAGGSEGRSPSESAPATGSEPRT
jgi:hypothetical protein